MSTAIILSINQLEFMYLKYENTDLLFRKTAPEGFVGWVYLYLQKTKPTSYEFPRALRDLLNESRTWPGTFLKTLHKGHLVGKFWLDTVSVVENKLLRDKWESWIDLMVTTNNKSTRYGINNEDRRSIVDECFIIDTIGEDVGTKAYFWHVKKFEEFTNTHVLHHPPKDWRLTEIEDMFNAV